MSTSSKNNVINEQLIEDIESTYAYMCYLRYKSTLTNHKESNLDDLSNTLFFL